MARPPRPQRGITFDQCVHRAIDGGNRGERVPAQGLVLLRHVLLVATTRLFELGGDDAKLASARDSLRYPASDRDHRSQRTEQQEHRLLQQHCDHTSARETEYGWHQPTIDRFAHRRLARPAPFDRLPFGNRARCAHQRAVVHVRRWSCAGAVDQHERAGADVNQCTVRQLSERIDGAAVHTHRTATGQLCHVDSVVVGDFEKRVVRLQSGVVTAETGGVGAAN